MTTVMTMMMMIDDPPETEFSKAPVTNGGDQKAMF